MGEQLARDSLQVAQRSAQQTAGQADASHAELRHPRLACEVFLDDGNDPALLFHGSFGFREVGQHVMPAADGQPAHRAAMLMKELCSYPWVRDTYGDRLPDVPWIAPPRHPEPAAKRATGT